MRNTCKTRWLVAVLCSTIISQCAALEPEQIWELVSPSCVRLEAVQLDGSKLLGTGFAFEIDGKKFLLSNRHVVQGARQVNIGHSVNKLVQSPSYRICPSLDFAIIDLPEKFTIKALKKRVAPLRTGERAYAIGFPLGLNKSITQGLVNSHSEEYVQFDAPISSGNSGGPLVDKDGMVIGVVTAGARGEAGELVQNFNLAINIAHVPKARVFINPIVSFYDAWVKLAEFESRLVSELSNAKAIEVQEYLMLELAAALFSTHLDDEAEFGAQLFLSRLGGPEPGDAWEGVSLEARRNAVLQKIQSSQKDVDSAVVATLGVLRQKVSEFDKVPNLFMGLGQQPLLDQYIKNRREDVLEIVRLNIEMENFVPLLTLSMERAKARYEDLAYQIEFLNRNRNRLTARDADFRSKLLELEKTLPALFRPGTRKRPGLRITYPPAGQRTTAESELNYFCLSLLPLPSPNVAQRAEIAFNHEGGFETHILGMFEGFAIDEFESTGADPGRTTAHLDRALGFIRNETAHRKFPHWHTEALIYVCRGEFEDAYKIYEKAFIASQNQLHPFTLRRKERMSLFDLDDVSSEQRGYATSRFYSESVQANWREWNRFILGKGGLSMADAISPQEVFASETFAKLTDFEKARIILRIQQRFSGDKRSSFLETVRTNPAAREVHQKYF